MPRKTTILIVLLAAVTGLLIFLAVRNETVKNPANQAVTTPSPTVVQPYASLGFSNPVIDASTTLAQTVDIVIDTSGKPVAGAQVELSYDPRVIRNVRLVPSTSPFFENDGVVLISSVDEEQGRISYAVGIGANGSEKVGSGTIVTLQFAVNRALGLENSLISFLEKSAITTLSTQNSVLLNTAPLQVILAAPTTSVN